MLKNYSHQWIYIYIVRAITLVGAKVFPFCTSKTYFFYFTHSFLQNTHINLSILQDISIKYYFFSIFLLLFSTTFTYNTRPLFLSVSLFFLIHSSFSIPISLPLSTDHLSLSLSLSLSFLPSLILSQKQPTQPADPPTTPVGVLHHSKTTNPID